MICLMKRQLHVCRRSIIGLKEILIKYCNACIIHMLYIIYDCCIRRHACFVVVEESWILKGRREREREFKLKKNADYHKSLT